MKAALFLSFCEFWNFWVAIMYFWTDVGDIDSTYIYNFLLFIA